MKRMLWIALALTCQCLMPLPSALAAGKAVGNVEKVTGAASVIRGDGTVIEAKPGLSLAPGDQVRTNKGGAAWLSIDGAGHFRLGSDSQMAVDELSGLAVEEEGISLRLIAGYLNSKIRLLGSKSPPVSIHTSTATIGIRGTDFDTMTAMDGSSAVAVDEGLVEVEAEDQQVMVEPGKMTEVEADEKPSAVVAAQPREQRDWETWRQRREEMMIKMLPQRLPKFRAGTERRAERFSQFMARMQEVSGKLHEAMNEMRQAKAGGDRAGLLRARVKLRVGFAAYRAMVMKFRKGMNQTRIMTVFSGRLQTFVSERRDRFAAADLETIESSLSAISTRNRQLMEASTATVTNIRQTFADLQEFKKEMTAEGDEQSGQGQQEPGRQRRFRRQG